MESPNRSTETISAIDSVEDEKVLFAPHPAVRPLASREILGLAAPPEENDEGHQYPGPLALALIIIGICLSVFIISVDRNIVTTVSSTISHLLVLHESSSILRSNTDMNAQAIPEITATFRSYDQIGWYGSAYFLTASAFQPLYGRVYMSFNVRWTFLAALAVFELGSIIGGVAPSSDVLILGRAIQGLGSAGILTGSFVVATHSVRMQKRPVLFAFVGILYGVGALCGPLIGGILTDLVTWRWIFWINLPIGAVTFVSVFFFFKPPKSNASAKIPPWIERILALDLIGNAILLGACVQLFIALELSQTKGSWNNAPCIGLITGFGVTVLIFVAWLFYKGDKALIPPRIIKQRTVAASCGAAFFIYGALLLQAFYLPIWFQAIKGTSALTSGVNMIPYMLTNALFSLLAGIFVSQNGLFAPPAIIGCAIGTIGSGLLATLKPDSSLGHWFDFEVLISAGLGMAIQQGFSAVQTALPLGEVPIGTAAVVAAQSLGGAVFVSVGNTVLQDHLLSQTNQQAVPGVDLRAIFQLGATMFRQYVPADQLPAVVELYNSSLQGVFISAVPLCGCAFLCSLCMEWRSVRRTDAAQAEAAALEKNVAAVPEKKSEDMS